MYMGKGSVAVLCAVYSLHDWESSELVIVCVCVCLCVCMVCVWCVFVCVCV